MMSLHVNSIFQGCSTRTVHRAPEHPQLLGVESFGEATTSGRLQRAANGLIITAQKHAKTRKWIRQGLREES